MKYLSFIVLIVLTGCGTLSQVDKYVGERVDQLSEKVEDAQVKMDDQLEKVDEILDENRDDIKELAKSYETLAKEESAKWREESEKWREEVAGFRAESEKFREESQAWRQEMKNQSQVFRQFMEEELARNREFLKEEMKLNREFLDVQRQQATDDLNAMLDRVPDVVTKSTAGAISSTGVPMKQDEDGNNIIDWIGVLALLLTGGKTLWRRFKGLKMVNGNLREEVKAEVAAQIQSPPAPTAQASVGPQAPKPEVYKGYLR